VGGVSEKAELACSLQLAYAAGGAAPLHHCDHNVFYVAGSEASLLPGQALLFVPSSGGHAALRET